jgi:hypothetical protein
VYNAFKIISVSKEYHIVPEITGGTDKSIEHSFVLVCAAVSLTAAVSLVCTVLSAIMCRSIANGYCVTGVYHTQCNYVPQYR